MSHGGDDDSAEGDLTPLLDLVLQLLMFFIINVNLGTEQTTPDVKLPHSSSATPLNKPVAGDVYLNQRIRSEAVLAAMPPAEKQRFEGNDSVIFISSKPPMTMTEARIWLKEEAERLKAGGKLATVTIH